MVQTIFCSQNSLIYLWKTLLYQKPTSFHLLHFSSIRPLISKTHHHPPSSPATVSTGHPVSAAVLCQWRRLPPLSPSSTTCFILSHGVWIYIFTPWKMRELSLFLQTFFLITNLKKRSHGADLLESVVSELIVSKLYSAIHIQDLYDLLDTVGRTVAYVDLEANPLVGKDRPSDLAALIEAKSITDDLQLDSGVNSMKTSVTAKASEVSSGPQEENLANTSKSSISFADTESFIEKIIDKTSTIILSKITEDEIKRRGKDLGSTLSNRTWKYLSPELKTLVSVSDNV